MPRFTQSWRNLKQCRPWVLLLPIIPPNWLKDGWRTMCRYLWMALLALHIPQGLWYNSLSSHLCFNHWQWQMQSTERECWRPFQAVTGWWFQQCFFLHIFYVCFGTSLLPQLEQQMQLELNTTWAPLELCEVSSWRTVFKLFSILILALGTLRGQMKSCALSSRFFTRRDMYLPRNSTWHRSSRSVCLVVSAIVLNMFDR